MGTQYNYIQEHQLTRVAQTGGAITGPHHVAHGASQSSTTVATLQTGVCTTGTVTTGKSVRHDIVS
jgi:hypothetical protein